MVVVYQRIAQVIVLVAEVNDRGLRDKTLFKPEP